MAGKTLTVTDETFAAEVLGADRLCWSTSWHPGAPRVARLHPGWKNSRPALSMNPRAQWCAADSDP